LAGGVYGWSGLDKVSVVNEGIAHEGDALATNHELVGCTKACFSQNIQDWCTDHCPDLQACAIALPNTRDGYCPQVCSSAYVGVSEEGSNMVLEPLDHGEHTNQGRFVDPAPEHVLHCDLVNDVVIAGLGVIRTNDCGLFELSYLVKGEVFVEALGDGAMPVLAAILLPCD